MTQNLAEQMSHSKRQGLAKAKRYIRGHELRELKKSSLF
jgi:hypothetical protein